MPLIRTNKILISAPAGTYKTRTALAYTEQIPQGKVALLFDSEHGSDWYLVEDPAQAQPGGPWYVERLVSATVYEMKFILAVIKHPEKEGKDLRIDRQVPVWADLSDESKALAIRIKGGEVKVDTVIFDTVTRLCEMTTGQRFGDLQARGGDSLVEKLSSITWSKIKDDISEVLFSCVDMHLNLIMTAWAKNSYDQQKHRPTDQLVSDVLKNVNYFSDLEVVLTRNPAETATHRLPPRAKVLKTRLERLPNDQVLDFTWANVLSAHPVYEAPPKEEVEIQHGGIPPDEDDT